MSTNRILLVEDNPDDILLTKRALRQAHIESEIIIAKNGIEAVEYLNSLRDGDFQNKKPDLVLLDLKMNDMNGHEFLEKIRKIDRFKLIPVVILSSSGEASDIRKSYQLGANSYIQKPVEFERFVETVQTLSAYWLGLNKSARGGKSV